MRSSLLCSTVLALAVASTVMPAVGGQRRPRDDRTDYIARALEDPHPPGVKGRRLIGTGTGFFIAPGKVLTNYHVVGKCRALTVGNNREGAEIDAKLQAGDASADLAVLAADGADAMAARFNPTVVEGMGARLGIVGYPSRGLPVLNAELDLVSASQADLMGRERFYPFNGEVRSGNSGSPVLDASGAVVGVVTAKIDIPAVYRNTGRLVSDDLGFAIHNRSVLDFLARHKIPFETASPSAPLTQEQLLEKARGFVRQIGCWR